ncbi:hypothetical protein AMTR_s00078p00091960 [Amborella trichopoda]|uniref:Uncharacterized protein n=1 Tax=Amborella trichopoda TaxID=13333 RepID=W1P1S4_AMBTC|nr:hypothetical protein AMTR_s00078p00091960 [Amborella trichopoda]
MEAFENGAHEKGFLSCMEGVLEGKEIGTGGVIVISTGSGIMTVIGTKTVVEEEIKMEKESETGIIVIASVPL